MGTLLEMPITVATYIPQGYGEGDHPVARSTVFATNRRQAVRLPKAVAFPDDIHQVEIIKVGQSRIVTPVGERWDDFLLHSPRLSADFMNERIDPAPEEREPL
ncbi:MAG TPA: type II toxin-antitoxin system VapB family antitoxin [Stellaceae bacterium]|nr:type II toxin-antitoxin system VapB family antitoxin [Stellaceae bacterium]